MVISMNGLGTKSARVSFEGCSYLEIIAPDPKQPSTPLANALAQLETGEMVPLHYAVRKSNATPGLNWVWGVTRSPWWPRTAVCINDSVCRCDINATHRKRITHLIVVRVDRRLVSHG